MDEERDQVDDAQITVQRIISEAIREYNENICQTSIQASIELGYQVPTHFLQNLNLENTELVASSPNSATVRRITETATCNLKRSQKHCPINFDYTATECANVERISQKYRSLKKRKLSSNIADVNHEGTDFNSNKEYCGHTTDDYNQRSSEDTTFQQSSPFAYGSTVGQNRRKQSYGSDSLDKRSSSTRPGNDHADKSSMWYVYGKNNFPFQRSVRDVPPFLYFKQQSDNFLAPKSELNHGYQCVKMEIETDQRPEWEGPNGYVDNTEEQYFKYNYYMPNTVEVAPSQNFINNVYGQQQDVCNVGDTLEFPSTSFSWEPFMNYGDTLEMTKPCYNPFFTAIGQDCSTRQPVPYFSRSSDEYQDSFDSKSRSFSAVSQSGEEGYGLLEQNETEVDYFGDYSGIAHTIEDLEPMHCITLNDPHLTFERSTETEDESDEGENDEDNCYK